MKTIISKLLAKNCLFFLLTLFVTTSNGQTIINITSGGDAGPTSGTNWSIAGTTLTATGTANIQASVIENALSSGNLTVVSATGSEYMILVNDPIEYTGATERTLTFGATHRMLVYENISSTSAPLNIILASEIDRASGFTGGGFGVGVFSTITTNGGDIWIGGGQLTGSWNGHTVGVGAAMGGGGANGVGAEISNATIGTNGGDVRILGTSNGLPGINAYWENSTIEAGAGNIELISDRMGFDFGGSQGDIQIDGTGTLTIAPLENSFVNAVTWDGTLSNGYYTSTGGANTIDGLKIKNTLGLTIGKPDNSAPLTIASDIVLNGPISFESGSFIINSSVDLETTAAGTDILVKVNDYIPGPNATDGYITIQGDNITTNGGNIIFWANASNRSSGTANNEIWFQGSNTLTSNGGKIVLAGGLDDGGASSGLAGLTAGDGIPDGFAYRGDLNSSAVIINDNVTLLSGGGDVIIRGQSGGTPPNVFPRSFGVWADAGFKLDAGTGTINIRGKSESESAIWLGTTESAGALSPIAITSASTAANAITIHGESTTNRHGLVANWDGSTGSHVLIESSGASGGGVSITGITNGANDGIILGQTATNESIQILSQAGDVSLISNEGLYIGNDTFLGNRKDANAVNGITPSVQSSSADILIRANSFNVGSAIDVSAAGNLTIEPYGNAFSSAYSTSGLTLGSSLTGLTIGKSTNTANVTISNAIDIAGPITVYGGDIAVNENLNTTAGGALGDVLLKATGNTSQAASKSITTSGGDVTLWADSDGSGAGYIKLTGGSNSGITSGGGDIFLGGGSDLATGYARGAAVTDNDLNLTYYIAGVHLRSDTEINSGGGNITLRGQNVGNSVGNGIVQPGIMGISTTLNAGTGKIALYGLAGGSGSANAQAISNSGSGWTIRSASTEADAITLIGDATSTNSSAASLGINFLGIIEATGNGGGIALTGTSGTSTSFGDGLGIVGDVLAASGTITITGTDDATNVNNRDVFIVGATLGSKTATNVTSSTANVVVRGNRPAFGSNVAVNVAVNTSGTFTLEPVGDDFTSAITYPIADLSLDAAVSGLTIGKASSADGTLDADVTIVGATSIAGLINIYGANLALNAALTATSSDINLHASSAVTQSVAITANGLGLHGAGTFTLTNTGNNVSTIAGGDNTTKLGSLSFVDASGGLTIGTVNPTGIVSTGPILIETLEGDITLSQNLSTEATTADAIVVNAGKNASAGTVTGGDIIVSGSPTITMGNGGIAKLFSGAASPALTALAGSENVRLGVDETTETFSPALSANNTYALYRMNASDITVVSSGGTNPTITNGLLTVSGTQNVNLSVITNYLDDNNNTSLTIQATGNITFDTALTATGDLTIMADADGNQAGDIALNQDISASTLTLGGNSATLAKGRHMNVGGNLVNNTSLVLKSDSNEFSSLKVGGSITGTGEMAYERFVNTFPNNDLIAAPFTGGLTFGDLITDSAEGSLETNPDNASMYLFGPYNTANDSYVNYTTTSHSDVELVAGKGYRGGGNDAAGADFATFKVNSSGYALHAVNVGIQLDNSGNGWNLVGNPYPTYLTMSAVLDTNSSVMYQGESWGIYGYNGSYTNDINEWEIFNNANSNEWVNITPGQGFFVRTDAADQSFTFTPSMQSNTGGDDFISGRTASSQEPQYVKLRLGNGQNQSHTRIYLNGNATDGLDIGYDTSLFQNALPQFGLYSHLVQDNQGLPMGIQTLNTNALDNGGATVPLGVEATAGTQLTFSIAEAQLPEGAEVVLEDVQQNSFTDLTVQDHVVSTSSALSGTGRFYLHLGSNGTLSDNETAYSALQVYAPKGSGSINIAGNVPVGTSLALYDMLGRQVLGAPLSAGTGTQTVATGDLATGTYIAVLKGNGGKRSIKLILGNN